MSIKVYNQTNNHNVLVYHGTNTGIPTHPVYLRVLDYSGNHLEVLIERECWLECHDSSINAHKYYEIIETVGGSIVAFWGRIFKDGTQSPKFGEIKNTSYSELLSSKTHKKDYKIMTGITREADVPDNYTEPKFKLIGVNGSSTGTTSRYQNPAQATTSQYPVPPSAPVIITDVETDVDGNLVDGNLVNVIDINGNPITLIPEPKVDLTDAQKMILQKLEQLESFAEEMCKKFQHLE